VTDLAGYAGLDEQKVFSGEDVGRETCSFLTTRRARRRYLERVQGDIASAEHFVLVTAFATSDGYRPLLEACDAQVP